MSLSGTAAEVVATNHAPEEVLAYGIGFRNGAGPDNFVFRQDKYFKTGITSGATEDILELERDFGLDLSAPIRAQVLYLQFADGREWGDRASGGDALLLDRQVLLQFINLMNNTYTQGGETALTQLLISAKQDNRKPAARRMASGMLFTLAQSGTAGIMSDLRSRMAAAALHDKTLHPQ